MEAAAGFAPEEMVGTDILHKPHALPSKIGLAQGIPNRLNILGGDQVISSTEQRSKPSLEVRRQIE